MLSFRDCPLKDLREDCKVPFQHELRHAPLAEHPTQPAYLIGYSAENGQCHCRESGRRCAVKTATIPVKTARV